METPARPLQTEPVINTVVTSKRETSERSLLSAQFLQESGTRFLNLGIREIGRGCGKTEGTAGKRRDRFREAGRTSHAALPSGSIQKRRRLRRRENGWIIDYRRRQLLIKMVVASIYTTEAQKKASVQTFWTDRSFAHLLMQIYSVLHNNTYYKSYTILIYLYTRDHKCTVQFTHVKY